MTFRNNYEVVALRFAHRDAVRAEHFYGGDDSRTSMPMSYYMWVIRSPSGPIVVDTGFSASIAVLRKRPLLADPLELLSQVGVDADSVKQVVITHMHYDHVGHLKSFRNAQFWLQRSEFCFWQDPVASRREFRRHVEVSDLRVMQDAVAEDRVEFVTGDASLDPSVSVHLVGGHSAGLQVVRIAAPAGPLVIGGDALHFTENLTSDRPYAIVHDLGAAYRAFDRVVELAGSPSRVLPGHDPGVIDTYPPASADLAGLAAIID